MSEQTFYVTTPIYYINDVPHLGHAYTTVAADFVARYHRQLGESVHFLTGTDEHGERIMRTAEANGVTPIEWADRIVPRWTEVWAALDISYDDFIRTTEERHEKPVQDFVQALYDKGDIYLGAYEGLYCIGCEEFKQPDELVDGKCPLHGTVPEVIKEDNYFFRLSEYRDALIKRFDTEERSILPEARRNEVLGKLRTGLDDLSISRVSFDWGVPIPWDPDHVIYVWIDALLNYATAVGYGSDVDKFRRIWPADIHLMAKDILWFHTVIWQAMLMALDLPLPNTVFAHGYLQVGGAKMSKSRLTGISPHDLLPVFGSDGYRYYFMRDVSFGLDGEFSWEGMVARYNSDLANDFGNLASRVTAMIDRYLNGRLPAPPTSNELAGSESSLRSAQRDAFDGMSDAMNNLALHDALRSGWGFVRKANAYVEEVAPWALAKDPSQRRRLEVALYELADALRLLAVMVWPIMPRAAEELWNRLGLPGSVADVSRPEADRWDLLPEGADVRTGPPLFPRIEDDGRKD